MAEFAARRVVAIAALAGAPDGGAVAGGVAVVSTSANNSGTGAAPGRTATKALTALIARVEGTSQEARSMKTTYRRQGGLGFLAAVAAIALAACGGGSNSAHVASLGTSTSLGTTRSSSSGRSTATTLPTGDPTRLLDEWAACMRRHGDPNQVDPAVTANKVIDITWDPATPGGFNGTNKGGQGNSGPGQYCRQYLNEAQIALQGGQPEKPPDPAQLEKFSECMRANGVRDFPDPSPGGDLSISVNAGGDLNPNNPIFHNAAKLCAQKTGVTGFSGTPHPGMIELNGAGPGGPLG